MKTKQADIKYCGVNEELIKNANPKLNLEEVKIHHFYLTERHEIYKKKEILKLPQSEWTNDEIFKKYRFTNIRRELDRESVWLIKNISENNEMSLNEKILWTILFRCFNKSSTFKKLSFPQSFDIMGFGDAEIDAFRERVEEEVEKDDKYVWFTGAFITGGLKGCWAYPGKLFHEATANKVEVKIGKINDDSFEKTMQFNEAKKFVKENSDYYLIGLETNIQTRMIHLIKWCRDNLVHEKVEKAKTQEEAFNELRNIPGIGNFLAYQIWVDLTYIPDYIFSENEFVVSGPGCSKGIDTIFEDKDGMNYEECIFWYRDNLKNLWEENGLRYYPNELFDHLPEYDRLYNVMMLENSFCEHSKNSRARHKTGRPRNNYKPRDAIKTKKQNLTESW